MNRIFFDKKVFTIKKANEYIVYSPINSSFIKVNEHLKFVVDKIIEHDGNIEIEELTKMFNNNYNTNIGVKIIKKQVDDLLKTNVFFEDEVSMQASRKVLDKAYSINEGVDIFEAYIHMSLRCNLNCSYCYNKNNLNKDSEELDTNTWIGIIENLKNIGVNSFIFTGGEPLIRKDLVEILKSTKEENLRYTLLTNGTMLLDRFDELMPYLDFVILSLDSLDLETNSASRGKTGFDNIIKLLDEFSKKAPGKIQVRAVINKNNRNQIKEFNSVLKNKYGIETMNGVFLPNSIDEVGEYEDYEDTKEDSCTKTSLSIKAKMCGACIGLIAIDPEGYIYPCQCLIQDKFKITNILKENWKTEFMESDIRKTFVDITVDDLETCKDCEVRYLCGGGCRALASNVYGDIKGYLEFMCESKKKKAIQSLTNSNIQWQ